MKIINQIIIKDYVVIEVSIETYFGNYAHIDGKEYPTEIVVFRLNQKVILSEKKCLFMIDLDKIKLPYGSFRLVCRAWHEFSWR